jgi:predicted nucleotidyltransferase
VKKKIDAVQLQRTIRAKLSEKYAKQPLGDKMAKPTISDPLILAFKKRLCERFPREVRKVLLYGSRARGDFSQGSDYDVIVLVERTNKELEEQICALAWDFGFEQRVSISVLVFEQALYEGDRYEPLFMNVRREGIAV